MERVFLVLLMKIKKIKFFGISLNNNINEATKIINEFEPSFVYIEDTEPWKILLTIKSERYLNQWR